MFDRYNYLKALNKNIEEKEHLYNVALESFELAISKINRGIIHGKKEQSAISSIKQCVSDITRASYELELAFHKKQSFLKNGVIKYE